MKAEKLISKLKVTGLYDSSTYDLLCVLELVLKKLVDNKYIVCKYYRSRTTYLFDDLSIICVFENLSKYEVFSVSEDS